MRTSAIPAFVIILLIGGAAASEPQKQAPPPAAPAGIDRGIDLARHGRCAEALPVLRKAIGVIKDKERERRVGMAGVRCAVSANQQIDIARFLDWMERDFPHDPEVLYTATHAYSDLSIRASQEVMFTAPASPQVHELNAEALETQGKWDEALSEYRIVLQRDPNLPGIHFRIGRLILSRPKAATTAEDARREFEEELKIDPYNSGAEYVLGELARQADKPAEAVEHFQRAANLDAGFMDAWIGLARSLMAEEKYADAVAPLQHAEKLQPADPAPHYFLSVAYRRLGRVDDATREAEAHSKAMDAARQAKQTVGEGIIGPQPAQGQPSGPPGP
ncbi:MAG TPA: tetratricopeptide repeat protein [Bryobacteraceae bacterium]|nr:tetratricopeptide repeat protein [Bryobacteraceae bacterium]